MEQKRILIIDDEPNLLAAMDRSLGRKGFRVMTAPNGQNGITLAKQRHPDLIILDLSMPGMGGEEVAIRLKDDPDTANIPIIFLTGLFSQEQQDQRGHKVGGQVFLAKPVESQNLINVINEVLSQPIAS
ncbi:MAG: response regulator [Sedimentisphaerales bacterium]|nr:response regulator [Sedimentisphaerales bacterium]